VSLTLTVIPVDPDMLLPFDAVEELLFDPQPASARTLIATAGATTARAVRRRRVFVEGAIFLVIGFLLGLPWCVFGLGGGLGGDLLGS
jgi:hypothetical protein